MPCIDASLGKTLLTISFEFASTNCIIIPFDLVANVPVPVGFTNRMKLTSRVESILEFVRKSIGIVPEVAVVDTIPKLALETNAVGVVLAVIVLSTSVNLFAKVVGFVVIDVATKLLSIFCTLELKARNLDTWTIPSPASKLGHMRILATFGTPGWPVCIPKFRPPITLFVSILDDKFAGTISAELNCMACIVLLFGNNFVMISVWTSVVVPVVLKSWTRMP
jgi:hypothetical protein